MNLKMKNFWQKITRNKKIDKDYIEIVRDLVDNNKVLSMDDFFQHGNVTCLEHSLSVSYKSYRLCKKFGLDYISAARGGLLHDFFLYDWRIRGDRKRFHGFHHPYTALRNADKLFALNKIEKDIIKKHMWPLATKPPKYAESIIVAIVDKYCATIEWVHPNMSKHVDQLRDSFEYQ